MKQDKTLLSDILREVNSLKKEKAWPVHVVAQAALVDSASGEIMKSAIRLKYSSKHDILKSRRKELMKKQAIRCIAQSLRFLENIS